MPVDPHERARLLRDGMLHRGSLECEECGRLIRPGESVLCADGYARVYGEFVPSDPLHEENWPVAHARCVEGLAAPPPAPPDED